jgi:hypothetical protein
MMNNTTREIFELIKESKNAEIRRWEKTRGNIQQYICDTISLPKDENNIKSIITRIKNIEFANGFIVIENFEGVSLKISIDLCSMKDITLVNFIHSLPCNIYYIFYDKNVLKKISSIISHATNIKKIQFECDMDGITFSRNNNIKEVEFGYINRKGTTTSLIGENVISIHCIDYHLKNISKEEFSVLFNKRLIQLCLGGNYNKEDVLLYVEVMERTKLSSTLCDLSIDYLCREDYQNYTNGNVCSNVISEIMEKFKGLMIFDNKFCSLDRKVDKEFQLEDNVYVRSNYNILTYCGKKIRKNIILRNNIKRRVKHKFFC